MVDRALSLLCLTAVFGPGSADLRSEMARIAGSVDGKVGAAVMLVETAEMVSIHGRDRFPMQSVYKAPIAMAVLRVVDQGRLRLDQSVHIRKEDMPAVHSPIRDRFPGGTTLSLEQVLRAAIVDSDGSASDALLKVVPPREVTRYVRSLGVSGMVIATTEMEMSKDDLAQYRSWATPEAAVTWLRALHLGKGLTRASRDCLLRWMASTPTGPRRIKGLLPQEAAVAHKTGTDRTRGGLTRATNDIGLITLPDGRDLAAAVFISDSRASQAERERCIARIARAAWDHWTSSRSSKPVRQAHLPR